MNSIIFSVLLERVLDYLYTFMYTEYELRIVSQKYSYSYTQVRPLSKFNSTRAKLMQSCIVSTSRYILHLLRSVAPIRGRRGRGGNCQRAVEVSSVRSLVRANFLNPVSAASPAKFRENSSLLPPPSSPSLNRFRFNVVTRLFPNGKICKENISRVSRRIVFRERRVREMRRYRFLSF